MIATIPTKKTKKAPSRQTMPDNYSDLLIANHKKWRLVRINYIDEALRAGKTPTVEDLKKRFEVSSKVIWKDVQVMREAFHRRVEHDPSTNSYFYDEDYLEVAQLGALPLAATDVLGLIAARKVLHHAKGTCLDKSITNAVKRIAANSSEKVTLLLGDWDHAISFRVSGYQIMDPAIFNKVLKGVVHGKQMTITYLSAKMEVTTRDIDPYHLSNINGDWYLFTFDHLRKKMRAFVPCRIQSVEYTGKRFKRPKGFRLDKHLKKSFGVWYGDEDNREYKVVVRFQPEVALYIKEKRWECQTALISLQGGGLEQRLTMTSLMDYKRWLGTWWGCFTVMQPPELREMIHYDAQRMLKNNPLVLPK
ncbi:MAG: Helix-turn-helix, type 11 domain protein [Verrucomicrobiales bacterium]|nr:Helix-turn-helix, type 11 domain protein [Verrucomicrobiales bacterium]